MNSRHCQCIMALLCAIQVTAAIYQAVLKIHLVSYSNPRDKRHTGSNCDYSWFGSGECDPYFTVSVYSGRTSIASWQTDHWHDTSYITFGGNLGNGVSNPLTKSLPKWDAEQGYRIHIVATDKDASSDDMIYSWERTYKSPANQETTWALTGSYSISLTLKISGTCLSGYFGESCETYCIPQSSYACDPTTGSKICYPGQMC